MTPSAPDAQFVAFTRTWGAACRMLPDPPRRIEKRLAAVYRRLVQHVQPAVVVEVGAHEASFSRWAAAELGARRCVAFEANPFVHEKYAAEVAADGVEYLHRAVTTDSGPVTLHLPRHVRDRDLERTSPMASLTRHLHASDTESVVVDGVRLDDEVVLTGDERAVLWVDVEGATEAVLRSGPALLAATDLLHVEVERVETWEGQWLDHDVARHLRGAGLHPIARDVTHRKQQYNLVFAHERLLDDPAVSRAAARVLVPRRSEAAED